MIVVYPPQKIYISSDAYRLTDFIKNQAMCFFLKKYNLMQDL